MLFMGCSREKSCRKLGVVAVTFSGLDTWPIECTCNLPFVLSVVLFVCRAQSLLDDILGFEIFTPSTNVLQTSGRYCQGSVLLPGS